MNPTVSSAEIREATGLSQKTLTRWHKGGHIPVPEIGQHPGGRGKMGYYPDHALALVRRIVALKKEGQPLKQAASQAGHEFEQREESGRPSMLDPITIESICKGIRIGLTNRDAAMRAGISEATFYSWMQKARKSGAAVAYVQFLESLERAQADLKAVLLARVQKAGSVDGATLRTRATPPKREEVSATRCDQAGAV